MDKDGQRISDYVIREVNPEEIFGIHPAEAALLLMHLSPQSFEVVRMIAAGMDTAAIAEKTGGAYGAIRVRMHEIRKALGCSTYGIAKIWYAAQFLPLYQEDSG